MESSWSHIPAEAACLRGFSAGNQAEEVMSPMVHAYQKQHANNTIASDSGAGAEVLPLR